MYCISNQFHIFTTIHSANHLKPHINVFLSLQKNFPQLYQECSCLFFTETQNKTLNRHLWSYTVTESSGNRERGLRERVTCTSKCIFHLFFVVLSDASLSPNKCTYNNNEASVVFDHTSSHSTSRCSPANNIPASPVFYTWLTRLLRQDVESLLTVQEKTAVFCKLKKIFLIDKL